MRFLRLDFLFMKIGKTGRGIFEVSQAPAASLALGNVLARPRRRTLRKFLVREEKKLLVRQVCFAALHSSLTPSCPHYTGERSGERQRDASERDAKHIGDLAVLQSFGAQIEAALILFGKRFEDRMQALLRLAEQEFLLCIESLDTVAGPGRSRR